MHDDDTCKTLKLKSLEVHPNFTTKSKECMWLKRTIIKMLLRRTLLWFPSFFKYPISASIQGPNHISVLEVTPNDSAWFHLSDGGFLGFSLVSGVEIFYWFIVMLGIRICCQTASGRVDNKNCIDFSPSEVGDGLSNKQTIDGINISIFRFPPIFSYFLFAPFFFLFFLSFFLSLFRKDIARLVIHFHVH